MMYEKESISDCVYSCSYFFIGIYYLRERTNLNNELFNIVDSFNEKNKVLYTEEFKDKIQNIEDNYSFRTNSQIKELIYEINKEINNGSCIKEEFTQLDEESIKSQINELLNTHDDFDIGKIFIYTDLNYRDKLEKIDDYVHCSIYCYGLSDDAITDEDSKVKIRGNSTANANKKPYNIKFSNKVNLCGFGESKKWSLLAEAYDSTMLRNHLFLDFAREMELEYTSNCEYVELWFDGNYNGLYLLTESVETGKNRVDIDVDNGDFLIEYESSRVEENVTYITTDHGWRFAVSDPEEPDENTIKYLKIL